MNNFNSFSEKYKDILEEYSVKLKNKHIFLLSKSFIFFSNDLAAIIKEIKNHVCNECIIETNSYNMNELLSSSCGLQLSLYTVDKENLRNFLLCLDNLELEENLYKELEDNESELYEIILKEYFSLFKS